MSGEDTRSFPDFVDSSDRLPAMSQENLEIVRSSLQRFLATGEIDMSTFHEDVEVHDHDMPDAGEYVGGEGLLRWLADWGDPWSEWSLEPTEWIDAGPDTVVVIFDMRATGRESGLGLERRDGIVYRLRHGLIARMDYFNSRAQALSDAGLDA
jgi:ketosteroid isomerase-like protein